MATRGTETVFSVAVSTLDIDLDTTLLELGAWDDTVNANGLLEMLKLNADSLNFDSSQDDSIPLQSEAGYEEEEGQEYSGGDKKTNLTTTMIAEKLDEMLTERTAVDALNGAKRTVYFYDKETKIVKKISGTRMGRKFSGKGGMRETCTISSLIEGKKSEFFQIKELL